MEAHHSRDHWRQRSRYLRIAHIRKMLLAMHQKLVEVGVKGTSQLPSISRELNRRAAYPGLYILKTMGLQPAE